jgi:hypothetical protein
MAVWDLRLRLLLLAHGSPLAEITGLPMQDFAVANYPDTVVLPSSKTER